MSSNNNNENVRNVVQNPTTATGEMQNRQQSQQWSQQQQNIPPQQLQQSRVGVSQSGQTTGVSSSSGKTTDITGTIGGVTGGISNISNVGRGDVSGGVGTIVNEPTIDLFNRFVAKDTHCLLGKTGIKMSRICLGTMNFGTIDSRFGERPGQLSESDAHKILDRFVELGGNCIDTADFFPWFGSDVGRAETIIGNWLSKRQQDRERVFLITKVRMPQDMNNINSIGLSRSHLIDSVKNSLTRLQTNCIDMLVLNGWDHTVSFHDTVKHLDDLVRCDKIRYIGVCDMKGWQLQKLIDCAKELDLHKCVCYMGEYNLLTRGCELEVLDVCKQERIGFIAYSPLKYGFLTNETVNNPNNPPKGTRIESASGCNNNSVNLAAMAESFECLRQNPVNINVLNVCQELSNKHNCSISQIAIQWLLQSGVVTSVCVGVEDVNELEECMRCLIGEFVLSQNDMDQLDMVSNVQLHYPYHTKLSDVAGLRQIQPLQTTEFEQLNVLTNALGLGGFRQERLNLRETWHESSNPQMPEREFLRHPQIKSNQQQQSLTGSVQPSQQQSNVNQGKVIQ